MTRSRSSAMLLALLGTAPPAFAAQADDVAALRAELATLQSAYAERIGVPVVLLPFSVGGTPEARDLFGLFDDTLKRLLEAVR